MQNDFNNNPISLKELNEQWWINFRALLHFVCAQIHFSHLKKTINLIFSETNDHKLTFNNIFK